MRKYLCPAIQDESPRAPCSSNPREEHFPFCGKHKTWQSHADKPMSGKVNPELMKELNQSKQIATANNRCIQDVFEERQQLQFAAKKGRRPSSTGDDLKQLEVKSEQNHVKSKTVDNRCYEKCRHLEMLKVKEEELLKVNQELKGSQKEAQNYKQLLIDQCKVNKHLAGELEQAKKEKQELLDQIASLQPPNIELIEDGLSIISTTVKMIQTSSLKRSASSREISSDDDEVPRRSKLRKIISDDD